MRKLLRIFLAALLLIAVPVSGTAASVMLAGSILSTHEAMQAGMNEAMATDHCDMAMQDDSPAVPRGKASNSCQVNLACKICHAYPSAQPQAWGPAPAWSASALVLRAQDQPPLSHDPSGLWRPPRSL